MSHNRTSEHNKRPKNQGREYEMQRYRDWESWVVLNTPNDPPRRLCTRLTVRQADHEGTAVCSLPLVRGAKVHLLIDLEEEQGGQSAVTQAVVNEPTLGDNLNTYYLQWTKGEFDDGTALARVGQDMFQVFRMQREFEQEAKNGGTGSAGSQEVQISIEDSVEEGL